MSYWTALDRQLKDWAAEIGLDYVTNDDSIRRDAAAPSVIVNYFYHEQIKKNRSVKLNGARKKGQ